MKAVEGLQKYISELQQSQQSAETLKDENISLIQRLEDLTQQAMAKDQVIHAKEQEFTLKVQSIEKEVGRYVGQKQEESQRVIQMMD